MERRKQSRIKSLSGHPRSIINYLGGKANLIENIVPLIEYIAQAEGLTEYIEATGGGARMLLNLPQSLFVRRVYNEIDPGLSSLFYCLGHREMTYSLIDMLEGWGIEEERYLFARSEHESWQTDSSLFYNSDFDRVYAAGVTFVVNTQSTASTRGSFDKTILSANRQASYMKRVRSLHLYSSTLEGVNVSNQSIFALLSQPRDWSKSFVYIDPPYTVDEMLSTEHYGVHSFSNQDHEKLVDLLLNHDAKIGLSGYANSIYSRLETNGWKKLFLRRVPISSSGTKGRFQDEYIWLNVDIPQVLIDMVADENYRLMD
ncbi:DNA adenine methylase [Paenibacillus sp. FSL R5-0912]|uniref:DNA adenine methylase n=1 Tax=Paenibacillus sp. FSL R5-0912 TaxID=1536771 RepID=UPI0004F65599|nr:DNA adenine methylase [Paenibacillus sp. FSL R5-0912]AIQ40514.1 hypothetical protein R50912_11135 [Paenibacillus sp. FSL R5-0912]